MDDSSDLPMNALIGAGCATLLLGSGLAFVMMKKQKQEPKASEEEEEVLEETLDKTVSTLQHSAHNEMKACILCTIFFAGPSFSLYLFFSTSFSICFRRFRRNIPVVI
jgi:hypothetical protein